MSVPAFLKSITDNKRAAALLLSIVAAAAFFRIYGLIWDQHHYLHPDERFLAMVTNDGKVPASLGEHLDPTRNPLNPYNIKFSFFVYGMLPIVLNKLFVQIFSADSYGWIGVYGRVLSAAYDLLTLVFLFLLAGRLEKLCGFSRRVKFAAAGFYAVAVLPIQNSHFFTSDSLLVMCCMASLYFAVAYHQASRWHSLVFCSFAYGAALGTKVSSLFIFPLIFYFIAATPDFKFTVRSFLDRAYPAFVNFSIFAVGAYLVLRFADPHMFASANLLNVKLNPQFIANIRELKAQGTDEGYFPPGIQWIGKPAVTFALFNIAFYGLGVGYFLLSAAGMFLFVRGKRVASYMIALWIAVFFLYQSVQFVKTMRYFYVLYPFFALFAGIAFERITSLRMRRLLKVPLMTVVAAAVLYWPLAFMAIYTRDHSRVAASKWIHENIPAGTILAQEHWDDGLPIPLEGGRQYEGIQMPVFAPDNEEKWRMIDEALARSQYIIFSSNRGYGSVGVLPEKYPKMAPFYWSLFDGKADWELLKEFTSFPTLNLGFLRIELDDQLSEEAFTVYDHPKVTIFKRR